MERDIKEHTDVICPQMVVEHYEVAGVSGTFSLDLSLWDSDDAQLADGADVDVDDVITVKAQLDGVDSSDDTLVLSVSL